MASKRQIFLCTIGAVFEWYEFIIFVYLTPIISQLFFPQTDPFKAMLATFTVLASGFVMRPIGAIIWGHVGDKFGRKYALVLTIVLMAIATTTMGLIPTTTTYATVILVICRLTQGLAASGEFSTSITLLIEQNNPRHKAFITSFGNIGATMGIFIGALAYAVISQLLGTQALLNGGWRVLFLAGAPIGIICYILRRSMLESQDFERLKLHGNYLKLPLLTLLKNHYPKLILLICIQGLLNVHSYTNIAYLGNYALTQQRITPNNLALINLLITFTLPCAILLFSLLTDYWNKKILLIGACLLILLSSYPLFYLAFNGSIAWQLAAQTTLMLLNGMLSGVLAYFMATAFPVAVRCSGIGLIMNLPVAILGGTAPMICSWLTLVTGKPIAVAYYVVFFAFLALISSLILARNNSVTDRVLNKESMYDGVPRVIETLQQ